MKNPIRSLRLASVATALVVLFCSAPDLAHATPSNTVKEADQTNFLVGLRFGATLGSQTTLHEDEENTAIEEGAAPGLDLVLALRMVEGHNLYLGTRLGYVPVLEVGQIHPLAIPESAGSLLDASVMLLAEFPVEDRLRPYASLDFGYRTLITDENAFGFEFVGNLDGWSLGVEGGVGVSLTSALSLQCGLRLEHADLSGPGPFPSPLSEDADSGKPLFEELSMVGTRVGVKLGVVFAF